MKKFLFIAFAALLLAACSGKLSKEDAKKEFIEYIEKATEKVKSAESIEDIQDISEELDKDAKELDEKVDEDIQKELQKDPDIQEASSKFMQVCFQKGLEFGASSL